MHMPWISLRISSVSLLKNKKVVGVKIKTTTYMARPLNKTPLYITITIWCIVIQQSIACNYAYLSIEKNLSVKFNGNISVAILKIKNNKELRIPVQLEFGVHHCLMIGRWQPDFRG